MLAFDLNSSKIRVHVPVSSFIVWCFYAPEIKVPRGSAIRSRPHGGAGVRLGRSEACSRAPGRPFNGCPFGTRCWASPGGKRTVGTQWRRQPKANNKQCLKETCRHIWQVCLDVCLPARKRESMAAKMDETLKQWKMTETKSLETANILHWSCHAVLACTAPIQSPNLR